MAGRRSPATALLTLAALCVSCARTQLPPISDSAVDFEPPRDERRLWERAREEERKLIENVTLYPDPLLVDYLGQVAAGLEHADSSVDYRVSVVQDPSLNAFAYPHGSLYVNSGLLARMENEDQLATVLAHEMTHVDQRHMLRFQRSARNKRIGLTVGAIAAAVVLAGEEGQAVRDRKYGKAARIGVLSDVAIGLGLHLAFIAMVHGYSRELEREADQGSLERLAAGGYDVAQAPRVYETLLAERGEGGKLENFFSGSHPQLASRLEHARAWIAEHGAASPVERPAAEPRHAPQETFLKRMRPVIRDDARAHMQQGRLDIAERQLERARELMPDDPETQLLMGELKLKRADTAKESAERDELRLQAAAAFSAAIRLDAERPAPHRELGLMAYSDEAFDLACAEFREYVRLDPRAEDAERIRDYVLELEREGHCD